MNKTTTAPPIKAGAPFVDWPEYPYPGRISLSPSKSVIDILSFDLARDRTLQIAIGSLVPFKSYMLSSLLDMLSQLAIGLVGN
jgi:hypothetical protein